MRQLWEMDATTLSGLMKRGELSAREVTEAHLARVEEVNCKVNALVQISTAEALETADRLDAKRLAGAELGPLHGVPMSIKITNDQKGWPTDGGVSLWKDAIATEDAPLVANLRAAGAVFIGRNNSPAFAMRFSTDNMLYGKTYNPWRRDISSGGSSGGAGAAVAAGLGPIAQGNDIGGSIRWPAFCNGVVGLRPTPGRVPAINPSSQAPRTNASILMAVQGPLARTIADTRLSYRVMAQGDYRDPNWAPVPHDLPPPAGPPRVALVTGGAGEPALHEASVAAVRRAGAHLAAAGYSVEEVIPPQIERLVELWNIIGMGEMRPLIEPLLDAVNDPDLTASLHGWWANNPVQPDLATYFAALAERDRIMREWQDFFQTYALVVTPVLAEPSLPAFADKGQEGMLRYVRAGRFLLMLPVLGFPALAIPVGQHLGQPQGVQIIAPRWREEWCLQAGEAIEAAEGPVRVIDPRW